MFSPKDYMVGIPKSHPRYLSLKYRHRLEGGLESGFVAKAGMIAHGRGEAFDYLLGEKTRKPAKKAIRCAAAKLLLAKHPVISVNGNVTSLCPKEIVELARALECGIEVNLFYRTRKREIMIKKEFAKYGAKILGAEIKYQTSVPGLDSKRAKVDKRGIAEADVVLVPLEDGDRTEALRKWGKYVIAIDLNPISRTAKMANLTIVDNVVRCIPLLTKEVKKMKRYNEKKLRDIVRGYNHKENLDASVSLIRNA
jgi:4-phosphopantoate--beta-alanine ligase